MKGVIMTRKSIKVIRQNDLPLGGFSGIVETRMVMSSLLWDDYYIGKSSKGFGDFVYLATGYFKPHDGAHLHPHKNIDIVTWLLSGGVKHTGTLGDNTVVDAPNVQVQRAGRGMRHAEIDAYGKESKFVQIWFLPPETDLTPAYQNITISDDKLTAVLGSGDKTTFANRMRCQVGYIVENEQLEVLEHFMVFITQGTALINGTVVTKGDLIEGEELKLYAKSKVGLVLITQHQS